MGGITERERGGNDAEKELYVELYEREGKWTGNRAERRLKVNNEI